jgi:hypothetical protein
MSVAAELDVALFVANGQNQLFLQDSSNFCSWCGLPSERAYDHLPCSRCRFNPGPGPTATRSGAAATHSNSQFGSIRLWTRSGGMSIGSVFDNKLQFGYCADKPSWRRYPSRHLPLSHGVFSQNLFWRPWDAREFLGQLLGIDRIDEG